MPRYRCYNERCKGRIQGRAAEFVSAIAECPHCSAKRGAVVPLPPIHFQIEADDGPILGKHDARFAIACNPMADLERIAGRNHQITVEWHSVTCEKCLVTDVWLAAAAEALEGFEFIDRRMLPVLSQPAADFLKQRGLNYGA